MDVGPFVTAVTSFQIFYQTNYIDVFKNSISVPGTARTLLFDCATEQGVNCPLFGHDDEDLYMTVKENIVRGPSIIFKRHHKTGESLVRGIPNDICKNIVGYDANALYLWAIGQAMPIMVYARISGKDDKYSC